jgi:hypothetical protein
VNHANASGEPWAWWKFCVDSGWLLETEPLEDMVNNQMINPFGIDLTGKRTENKAKAKAAFDTHQNAIRAMILMMDEEEIQWTQQQYNNLSGAAPVASPATSPASPGPSPAIKGPAAAPVSTAAPPTNNNPYACVKCRSTATALSGDLVNIMVCQTCGWQWDKNGAYFEKHPWMKVMCPIPPAGVKKRDYTPITLGQMMRTEPERAFGFWNNYHEANSWTGSDGTVHEPDPASIAFAAACLAQFNYANAEKKSNASEGNASSESDDDGAPF